MGRLQGRAGRRAQSGRSGRLRAGPGNPGVRGTAADQGTLGVEARRPAAVGARRLAAVEVRRLAAGVESRQAAVDWGRDGRPQGTAWARRDRVMAGQAGLCSLRPDRS